jgi:predicted regulator of Ras-like GTPase activity (Roadblock/LC7/MglB family)
VTPSTPFGVIIRDVVESTPGAVGAAFAAADGETVDSFSRWDGPEWQMLTAHYGVVLALVQSALHTFHYGEAELVVVSHRRLDLLIRAVADGYFALIAVEPPAPLGRAIASLERASGKLLEEMS